MEHSFDQDYWETHWQEAGGPAVAANPYLASELGDLTAGSALDAGCGEGAEAIWLAQHGWSVTGVDISTEVLARAEERARAAGVAGVSFQQADLSTWVPETSYDLVTSHYAHPAIPQLDFYERISDWVAPGGTLLIVGHLHEEGHEHPAEATATAASITARLHPERWEIVTAAEPTRDLGHRELHDVVVRAVRR